MMRRFPTLSAAMLAAVIVLTGTGCSCLKSRDHLNKGIVAYGSARYGEAIEHFKQSIALDPTNLNPREYLATAYMVQWTPGSDSPENNELAKKAKEGFMDVLSHDPKDKTALASLAMIAYNEAGSLPTDQKAAKFDESASWQKKRLEVDPNEKEAYYSLGVIAYGKWIPAIMGARSQLKMKPEDPGPLKDKKVKAELKEKYGAIVDE